MNKSKNDFFKSMSDLFGTLCTEKVKIYGLTLS